MIDIQLELRRTPHEPGVRTESFHERVMNAKEARPRARTSRPARSAGLSHAAGDRR